MSREHPDENAYTPEWFQQTFIRIFEERVEQNHWRRQAACIGMDPNMFFPLHGDRKTVLEAKRVCAGCPVRAECHEHAMSFKGGIYGGMGEAGRRTVRAARRREGAAA